MQCFEGKISMLLHMPGRSASHFPYLSTRHARFGLPRAAVTYLETEANSGLGLSDEPWRSGGLIGGSRAKHYGLSEERYPGSLMGFCLLICPDDLRPESQVSSPLKAKCRLLV